MKSNASDYTFMAKTTDDFHIAARWAKTACLLTDAAALEAAPGVHSLLEVALGNLNVTDQELLRIRNQAEHSESENISSRMLQKLVDHIRELRAIAHTISKGNHSEMNKVITYITTPPAIF
jgi:hypothetical protein